MIQFKKKITNGAKLLQRTLYSLYKYRKTDFEQGEIYGIAYLWIWPSCPFGLPRYLISDSFIKDLALAKLLKKNFKVKFIIGSYIGSVQNSYVFFNYDQKFDRYRFTDYASALDSICAQLEKQGNIVVPSRKERILWENKAYMHQEFERLGVRTPYTKIVKASDILSRKLPKGIEYPFLLKEIHSCSSNGVHKITNSDDLIQKLQEITNVGETKIILQSLIDMRRDLRVICVRDKILLHYWRINPRSEWFPTASKFGSHLKFGDFPEKWRTDIQETFKKLEIGTGAFDVAWHKDDLDSLPLYLEVSPSYQPNPIPTDSEDLKNYGAFKKSFRVLGAYDLLFVDIVFEIQKEVLEEWLNIYVKKRSIQPLEASLKFSATTDSAEFC